MLDRAIWGHDETAEIMREDGRSFAKRRRLDSRLGLAMLARLDKMVETRARAGEEMLAQVVAGDWPGFLSLFDTAAAIHEAAVATAGDEADADDRAAAAPAATGLGAALALWLAGRDNRTNPLAALWKDSAIANEVAQISADPGDAPEPEPTPEEEAAAMTVWYDDAAGELRTNFPPPDGFIGIEDGIFGHDDYERTLDPDEQIAWEAAVATACAPLRTAGEAARRAYFRLPAPANDAAPEAKRHGRAR